MAKNPCLKTRPVDKPYEIWHTPDGDWEWHVLKKYKNPESEAHDPYARWFCAVYSPITREQSACGYDLGDCYAADIRDTANLDEESLSYGDKEGEDKEILKNLTRHRGAKLRKPQNG